MSSRPWVLAGLLCGVITGLAVLALVVAFGPEPGIARGTVAPTPAPTTPLSTTAPPAPTPSLPARTSEPSSAPPTSPSPAASIAVMHVGQPAPPLVVPQVGGGTIDLAALRGRPVWVMFLVASCTACLPELTAMNGFLERYSATDLVVLAISVRDDEGAVANVARGLGATLPFGLDLDGSTQQAWQATPLPAHYWIDRDAVVRQAATGILGAEAMARGLGTILPGTDVRP
jgi:peroxiredoxin